MHATDYEFNGQPWSVCYQLSNVSATPHVLVAPETSRAHPAGIAGQSHVDGYGLVITHIAFTMDGTAGNGFRLQTRDYGYSPGGSEAYTVFAAQSSSTTVATALSLSNLFIPLRRGIRVNGTVINGSQLEIVQITGALTRGHLLVAGFHTTKDFGIPPYLPTPNTPNLQF